MVLINRFLALSRTCTTCVLIALAVLLQGALSHDATQESPVHIPSYIVSSIGLLSRKEGSGLWCWFWLFLRANSSRDDKSSSDLSWPVSGLVYFVGEGERDTGVDKSSGEPGLLVLTNFRRELPDLLAQKESSSPEAKDVAAVVTEPER